MRTDDIKIPPHSIEAEQSVLGALLLDNKTWPLVEERLSDDDFYRRSHKILFSVIRLLLQQGHPADVLTVAERLKLDKTLDDAGGEVYLFELAKNTPTAFNVGAYADIVQERAILRRLIAVSNEIAGDAFHPPAGQSIVELLDAAERKVFSIAEKSSRGAGPQNIKSLLTEAVDRIDHLYRSESALVGVATGYTDLDDMTSGLQSSDLIIIAGRPSMGKTAFAMNIVEHVAVHEKTGVLVFSMEMSGASLALRLMSSLGKIDQHKVRTGKLEDHDWANLTEALGHLSEAPIFIDDTPALSPAEVRSRARRVAREHNLGLIVVDYLQLMQMPGYEENRTLEISSISRALKALAKELNIPVVALSQLNRGLEQRADKRPIMSDLRESGAIEQDADLIAFIYRDEVYHEDTRDKGIAEIIIAKQRNGPIGKVRLTFRGQYTRFENFTPQQAAGIAFV
ncbi:MAG: replicative DNA helicase [Gammaproteobacteria bacterium]|nr:replicative DNA helicase [Gammaproteobacteria bacterium]MCD8542056.1 replicative DNA helicase [Gammaproteobacteria bacterium]